MIYLLSDSNEVEDKNLETNTKENFEKLYC